MKTSAAGAALRLSPLLQAILHLYKTSLLVVEGVLAVLVRICSLMYGSEFSNSEEKIECLHLSEGVHERIWSTGFTMMDSDILT